MTYSRVLSIAALAVSVVGSCYAQNSLLQRGNSHGNSQATSNRGNSNRGSSTATTTRSNGSNNSARGNGNAYGRSSSQGGGTVFTNRGSSNGSPFGSRTTDTSSRSGYGSRGSSNGSPFGSRSTDSSSRSGFGSRGSSSSTSDQNPFGSRRSSAASSDQSSRTSTNGGFTNRGRSGSGGTVFGNRNTGYGNGGFTSSGGRGDGQSTQVSRGNGSSYDRDRYQQTGGSNGGGLFGRGRSGTGTTTTTTSGQGSRSGGGSRATGSQNGGTTRTNNGGGFGGYSGRNGAQHGVDQSRTRDNGGNRNGNWDHNYNGGNRNGNWGRNNNDGQRFTHYGSNNNRYDTYRNSSNPFRSQHSLPYIVLRGENVRYANSYRHGYVQYSPTFCDDNFHYSYYAFTPVNNCAVSPWYFYSVLPGYISYSRIVYSSGPRCNWGSSWGRPYSYISVTSYGNDDWNNGDRYGSYSNRDSDLDRALSDLTRAFENNDTRLLDEVVPKQHQVGIYIDGQYTYDLNADDFYHMLQDNVESVRTVSYRITNVRREGAEVQVTARHEYENPWGGTEVIYHRYKLQQDREGYFITDFMTSHSPNS